MSADPDRRGEPTGDAELERLLIDARPRLVRALYAIRGHDGARDAANEAIAWGWEHGEKLLPMENPIGYLYRVALTRSTPRKRPHLPPVEPSRLPAVEPGLVPALLDLPERQRCAVWLVHACEWTHAEVAEALGIARTTVGNHVARGMASLRTALGHEPTTEAAPHREDSSS